MNGSPIGLIDWPSLNRAFCNAFREWLQEGGYSDHTIRLYSIAVRLALGLLEKPYWLVDPEADLDRVWRHVITHCESESTCSNYRKGFAKLAEFLCHCNHRQSPKRPVNWEHYVGSLPEWLADDVRAYVAHRRRGWVSERQHRGTIELLSPLTLPLRWMAAHNELTSISDLVPRLWFDYLDARIAQGIKPATSNRELAEFQAFLRFLADEGRPICQRTLWLDSLPTGPRLPRDVPLDQLRLLLREIEADAASDHAGVRRMGILDRAWSLLMLHCGLRTGEIRRLKLSELDLAGRRVRIEQSKGLKDRVVPLGLSAARALQAYLEVRGEASTDHVFTYRHQPLSNRYCWQRLRTYGRRCGIRATPHQFRHSCGTLLLNAGAPILTVQAVLGHKHIDTTLQYARLYDGTVAADYYQAMEQIESRLDSVDDADELSAGDELATFASGRLLALVDSLRDGTLNEKQRETVNALRTGILVLAGLGGRAHTATHCGRQRESC